MKNCFFFTNLINSQSGGGGRLARAHHRTNPQPLSHVFTTSNVLFPLHVALRTRGIAETTRNAISDAKTRVISVSALNFIFLK